MKLSDEAEKIRRHDWHQGSLLKLDSSIELSHQHGVITSGLYIIISQDCDIQTPTVNDEPYVEIILCDPISQSDGNYTRGKSARRLHIPFLQKSTEVYFECAAKNKFFFDRQKLSELKPCEEFIVAPETINDLIGWCIKRYDRDAFPDSFNTRLNKKKLRNIMKSAPDIINYICVKLTLEKNLSLNEPYEIILYFLADKDISNNESAQCEEILNQLISVIEHDNSIKVIDGKVLTIDNISLSAFMELKQLDFDDLSSL